MVIVKDCPYEGNGQVGFLLFPDVKKIACMCDECDTVWLDPGTIDAYHGIVPKPPDFLIEGIGSTRKARWATREEVVSNGWAKNLSENRSGG